MIVGRGISKEGPLGMILLGLSRGNIEKLLKGFPIRMNRKTHGKALPLGWEIFIIAGETEESIRETLEDLGALDGTDIQRLPSGAD